MNIGTIINITELPDKNINADVAGKYSDIHFRIHGNGYDARPDISWPEHNKAAYTDEVKRIFVSHGWVIAESAQDYISDTATKGRNSLYLHPNDFSGVCENAERERMYETFKNASTFKCSGVDVYEEVFDMSNEQLLILLESKREIIKSELLETFKTKRRNLYFTDVGFFGLDGKVAKAHSVKRLAIDGKESYGGCDKRTDGICHKFVSGILSELLKTGEIVTTKTKNGLGYRTIKKGEPMKKSA